MEERTCRDCGDAVFKKPGVGRWPVRCPECRSANGDAAKYDQLRSDPERWSAWLAKRRATYTPKPPRPLRLCTVDDCSAKHLARGMCRKHYRSWQWANGEEVAKPTHIIGSMASLHGAYYPKPKMVKVKVATGVLAYCPACTSLMGAVDEEHRYCNSCGTTLTLNMEEVSWVISEQRSIEASMAVNA